MRIIGGSLAGIRLSPPASLPVRPTTDIAKEALFNILEYRIDWEETVCLDLFCGTGNISFELASRGAKRVDAVDIHFKCIQYVQEIAKKHHLATIKTRKADVFRFIGTAKDKYDFIFADPPYAIGQLPQLPKYVFDAGLLNPGGILVVEHPSTRVLQEHVAFEETRKYGYSSFSFYQNK